MDNQKKMTVTIFKVKEMDCPSEENIIRMKLAELGDDIASLDFDLRKRTLAVTHSESAAERLADAMESVDMGAKIIETRDADAADRPSADTSQRRVLYRVLLVNAVFFALEMVIGLLSRSMGGHRTAEPFHGTGGRQPRHAGRRHGVRHEPHGGRSRRRTQETRGPVERDFADLAGRGRDGRGRAAFCLAFPAAGVCGHDMDVGALAGRQCLLPLAPQPTEKRRRAHARQRHLLGQRRGGQPRSHSFGRGGMGIQQPCTRPRRRSRGVRHRPARRRPHLQTFTLKTVTQ